MGSPFASVGDLAGVTGELTSTERAVLGDVSVSEVLAFFSAHTLDRLGSPVAAVRFRAGRIDAVWGVELGDGRAVVIKSHRLPVDLEAISAARDAQRVLRAASFPCPAPLAGPDKVDGQVLSVETLLGDGLVPDGREPENRYLLAAGLARHIQLLRREPGLIARAGAGPSWCRYVNGPWPVPHDPIVDFRSTPDGYGWLDDFAQRASDQVLAHRDADQVVVGHADWYAGNASVADGTLVGTFDWELVADAEAVIAGFTAACYASSSTSGGGLSTPEEAAAFLRDYDEARGRPMTGDEQRAAAGSAAWILAFNARWEVGMRAPGQDEGAVVTMVRKRQDDYLALTW